MNIIAMILLVAAVVVLVAALRTNNVKRYAYYLAVVGLLFGFLILGHILALPGVSL
jgi:hypothetical protein